MVFFVLFCLKLNIVIEYQKYTLSNGLRVVLHQDLSTPLVALSIVYDVGSKDEDEKKTGFAHLFEHLMFGGSKNIKDFDSPLQLAGGENNGFTNNDMINFYEHAPAQNLETLLWLESDRMLSLDFSEKSLEIQKKVVVEEFKETILNEPYGDAWHHLLDLAYKKHPYKWPTIGLKQSHIKNATIEDVKSFYKKYFNPNNAVLCIAGNLEYDNTKLLVEKWFGDIPSGIKNTRNLEKEPLQKEERRLLLKAKVPVDHIFIGYKMGDRLSKNYLINDLISDLLCDGPSSILYRELVKNAKLFSEIDAYLVGSFDPGLFIIEGKPSKGVSKEKAEAAINTILKDFCSKLISKNDVQKILNRIEYSQNISEYGVVNKALNLCYYEVLGNISLINDELDNYKLITAEDIKNTAFETFKIENTNVLWYVAEE
jgi:zinc protease